MEKGSTVKVIVETPKGSTEKYDYDPESGFFKMNKVLPAGMAFPYDFGFITHTKGEDGDPLDIVIISEFKTFPGCLMECKVIGAIKATQTERNRIKVRNDRFIGIPEKSQVFASVNSWQDIERRVILDIQDFFVHYNALAGKIFKPLGMMSVSASMKTINQQVHK